MTYAEALGWLWGLTDYERRTGYDYSAARFDLERVRALLRLLGDPQRDMRLAHVAGTKGKGSTCAMLAGIYQASGLRTGLYTSPHLHTVRERVQVDRKPVSRQDFAGVIADVSVAAAAVPEITSFEALTAAGLLHFRRVGVDVGVMEVGLGGRLDATNVIEPFVSVIASISHDHTAVLGEDLASIAGEKAGIIKPGVPVVSAWQVPEAAAVIADRARQLGCAIEWVGADWRYTAGIWDDQEQEFELRPPARVEEATGCYHMAMLGEHQIENAVLALAAADRTPAELGVTPEHWRSGLRAVRWPGRLEMVHRRPYVVLDGAHNDDSFRRLGQALARHFPHRRLHLVFGASRDKDIVGMLAAIAEPEMRVYGCRSPHGRAAELEPLAEAAAAAGLQYLSYESVTAALSSALECADADDCVCVSGSLFVVAAAREAIAARHGRLDRDENETDVLEVVEHWRPALVRA